MDNCTTFLFAPALKPYYDKLPERLITPLIIREDEVEVSPWKQFLSRFRTRALAYEASEEGLEDAGSRFLEIFYDNLFILEQLKKANSLVEGLSNFDNWQLVTNSITASSFDSSTSGATYNNTTNSHTNTTTLSSKVGASDSNSYVVTQAPLANTDSYPLNSYSGSLSTNNLTDTTKTDATSINKGVSKGSNQSVSRTGISNTSEDLREYWRLELPQLRNRFWAKFRVLFVY